MGMDNKGMKDNRNTKNKITVTKLVRSKQLSTTLSVDDNPFLIQSEVAQSVTNK
jgi:hypothetical protein